MIIVSAVSLLIVLAAGLLVAWRIRSGKGISYQTALVVLVAAVFTGLVIIGFPLSFRDYSSTYPSAATIWLVVTSLLQSMQNALRTFVLDGSWSELLPSEEGDINLPMFTTLVGLTLNVVAPMLTFSAILSLFKEITSKIRVHFMASGNQPLFLFSELNSDTIFLAEDIRRIYPRASLVYTDVYPEDDEANYELRERADKLRAVMLRTDISELEIKDRKPLTEYFLLGHDEKENVMQARKLCIRNKGRTNNGIYVKAARKGHDMIIDSLTASLDIAENLEKADANHWDYETLKSRIRNGGILRLRRVDPDVQTAWREIPKMQCIRDAFAGVSKSAGDTLSILVFADTHLSFTFIKTLLWFCQSDKFRLELNIVYADDMKVQDTILSGTTGEKLNVRSLLEFECPDIIRTNRMDREGDAFYDIEFIGSSKFESGDFQMKLIRTAQGKEEQSALAERLLRTDAVITDRGSDGDTLETAVLLRTIFERIEKKPEIYALCADEDEILKDINMHNNIVTYKDQSYDLRFIGKRSDTHTYENIKNTDEENLGFCQHIKWIDVSDDGSRDEEKQKDLKRELLNYERHEYFRNSSIVKAKYLRNVLSDPDLELNEEEAVRVMQERNLVISDDDNSRVEWRLKLRPEYECLNAPEQPRDRWKCACEKCMLRRELEHNRWNAYMRTEGYIPSPNDNPGDRRPLAKVHGNLVPFGELRQTDREKDG